jgi:hypothetical protein
MVMQLHPRCIVPTLLFACSLTGGCGSSHDVSRDAKFLGPMAIGDVYALQRDVFLYRSDRSWDPVHDWLLPEGSHRLTEQPLPDVQEYRRTRRPPAIRDVLPAGTRLSLTKILFQDAVTWAESYYVFTLRDGPSSGKVVCANELMTRETRHAAAVPNDQYLHPAR